MKIKTLLGFVTTAIAMAFFSGCASSPKNKPVTDGVRYYEVPGVQRVWLAEGFNFKGFYALHLIEEPIQAQQRPNEVKQLAAAREELQSLLVREFQKTGLFPLVTIKEDGIEAGAKVARLEYVITEYEKGGGGARWWAGAFGAGQPTIRVRGKLSDAADAKALFRFETVRSGDSGASRMFGGYMSDEEIQLGDIRDLVKDLVDFVKKSALR